MAGAIRFTKAERAFINEVLSGYKEGRIIGAVVGTAKGEKLRDAILDKLELAELPVKKRTYLTVPDAISAFREVLGPRLLAPRFEAVGVLAQMKNRIQALALTRQDCITIAKVASAQWAGTIRAESLVRQADKLLADGQLGMPFVPSTPQPNKASPVELGDEDI